MLKKSSNRFMDIFSEVTALEFMLEIIKKVLEESTKNVAEEAKKNSGAVQDKLLELLKLDNKISAKSVADKLEMSERQVQRLLKNMKDEGIIERVGSNRNGTWKVL